MTQLLGRIVNGLALAATTGLAACGGVTEVKGARAHALVGHGAMLVDVRTPEEFEERHPPEAVNIPLDTLKARLPQLDHARPVVVYCHSGVRAAVATRWLRKAGFSSVYFLGTLGRWYEEKATPTSFE